MEKLRNQTTGFMRYVKLSPNNIVIFWILILAFILRIIDLGSKSLWLDEAVNVWMAEKSVFSWDNPLPPLYFAVLHFWLGIGKSEVSVRFLSVILGVFSVYIIYKIGRIIYTEKEAIVGAFLLSISPIAIDHSQAALYYSLFIPLSLFSVYSFLKMEEKPTNSNKILFLVSIVLSFYAHYFTVVLLFVFIIFKIWKYKYNTVSLPKPVRSKKKKKMLEYENKDEKIKEIKSFFLLLGIFFLLILPILPLFISQTIGKAGISNINFAYQTHFTRDFLKEIFTYLIVDEFYEGESILLYIMLGLFLYGVFSSFKYPKERIIFLMMWLFIPVAFAAVLTNIVSNLQIRYIIFILPSLYLIASRGILAIPGGLHHLFRKDGDSSNKFNLAVIMFILIIVVQSSYPILNVYYNSKNYDWRGTAELIEKNVEDDSNIVLVPGYNNIPFNYYYKSNKTNVVEYSTFDEFIKISNHNNTYLVITPDAYGIRQDEQKKLAPWIKNNMEFKAQLSGDITIFKNLPNQD
ncbi:MAG: glycosyltransferase family 39 protein [Candidatus Methanoperedens sp.]